ncbi:hypothetical protein ACIQU5_26660 [Streptomyces sp. NPDC090306]|uniref:hypothetical protein n=1 Tax=unclassified Streptomyces TaxID=2593676 RepID=UPI0036E4E24F
MAQAAPAPGGMSRGAGHRPAGPSSDPSDVFSDRAHRIAKLAVPLVLGLVYGYWAASNRRAGGEITGWNILFGFVTAIVFMVVLAATMQLAARLTGGLHAVLWFVFTGVAFGFVYSQSGNSILRSVFASLGIGALVFAGLLYHYSTQRGVRRRYGMTRTAVPHDAPGPVRGTATTVGHDTRATRT